MTIHTFSLRLTLNKSWCLCMHHPFVFADFINVARVTVCTFDSIDSYTVTESFILYFCRTND